VIKEGKKLNSDTLRTGRSTLNIKGFIKEEEEGKAGESPLPISLLQFE
jgi:hypothetical protein